MFHQHGRTDCVQREGARKRIRPEIAQALLRALPFIMQKTGRVDDKPQGTCAADLIKGRDDAVLVEQVEASFAAAAEGHERRELA